MYDVIIIGAGPAGITSAVYAARKMMNGLIISKDIGGQSSIAWNVENYEGYQFITASELVKKFDDHVKEFDIELRQGEQVTSIQRTNNYFIVSTADQRFETLSVIIATGRKPKTLDVAGEREYIGRGVSYCATCDAPFFSEKTVAVVGGGNAALHAIIQLISLAKKIFVINIADELTGDSTLIRKVEKSDKVSILNNTEIKSISGNSTVKNIIVRSENLEEKTFSVDGVLIEIGSEPELIAIKDTDYSLDLNEYNEIRVNNHAETSIPGLFAAGDVTNIPEKQIIIASGQGCMAGLSAYKYVKKKETDKKEKITTNQSA